jgi:uncharacterized protein with NRDE domain
MCLVALAWRVHPEHPLVLIGNRDEFHARPSAPADWWSEPDDVLGGRDLEAGGSWLAATRSGRFAVVTNYREPGAPPSGRRSRGELVTGAVTTDRDLSDWIADLGGRAGDYGGFNLLAGDDDALHYASNRGADRLDLAPGVYGLSNGSLDEPWPKVAAARRGLERIIGAGDLDRDRLFELLADRAMAPDADLPRTGVPLEWERVLSAAFIVGDEYGTRASTVITRDVDGETNFTERRFGPGGAALGESSFAF